MGAIRNIIDASAFIAPGASCAEAHLRFCLAPNLVALALVDEARPVGLLSRNAFYLQHGDALGRALFKDEPVAKLAAAASLLVEADTPLEDFCAILDQENAAPSSGFIAVEHGVFLGVGAAASVYRAVAALATKQAVRLAKLSDLLEEARLEAEAADVAKSRFIANMGHELRTQLNAIHGYAELIADEHGLHNEALRQDACNIVAAGRDLLGLINQVLDFARLESGGVEVDPEPIDLDHWLQAAVDLILPLAERNGNELVVEADAPLGEACADADRLRQCLFNVAANACKFTTGGRVTIGAHVTRDARRRWLVITVADTGIGMSPAQVKKLFKPFEQTDARIALEYGGNGLGLSITKQLVELMGGRIEAASEAGQGSEFEIAVPIDPADYAEYALLGAA